MSDRAVYRILDAAANRAAEGLRTVEEYARFALNSETLSRRGKELRHALTAALSQLSQEKLLVARDTPGDCGTSVSTPSEVARAQVSEVLAAAMARVEQSLRCLEEYGKLVSVEMAQQIEQVRYASYAWDKDVRLSNGRHQRIERATLYVLVDLAGEPEAWGQRVRRLALAGADIIQLRGKGISDLEFLRRAEIAADVLGDLRGSEGCQLIINDRADIAVAVDADGVHVGQDELTVAAVRRVMGDDKLVGVSTHDLEQARLAVDAGADYIGCGPTFPSRTKQFDAFAGLEFLRQVASEIALPAFAIGGIDGENLSKVLETGFQRVAVSGAVWGQEDLEAACARLKR